MHRFTWWGEAIDQRIIFYSLHNVQIFLNEFLELFWIWIGSVCCQTSNFSLFLVRNFGFIIFAPYILQSKPMKTIFSFYVLVLMKFVTDIYLHKHRFILTHYRRPSNEFKKRTKTYIFGLFDEIYRYRRNRRQWKTLGTILFLRKTFVVRFSVV